MKGPMCVFTVMRCQACGWLWMISQDTFMAHDYFKKLPNNPEMAAASMPPITVVEMEKARKALDKSKTPLKHLFEGPRPERAE